MKSAANTANTKNKLIYTKKNLLDNEFCLYRNLQMRYINWSDYDWVTNVQIHDIIPQELLRIHNLYQLSFSLFVDHYLHYLLSHRLFDDDLMYFLLLRLFLLFHRMVFLGFSIINLIDFLFDWNDFNLHHLCLYEYYNLL